MTAERVLMGLLLGGIGIGCVQVLYPFFSAILWAAILTYTAWPMYDWLRARLKIGHVASSLAMVLIVAVVILLPLAVAAPSGADDAGAARADPGRAGGRAARRAAVAARSAADRPDAVNLWNSWAADLTVMVSFFKPYFGIVAEAGCRCCSGSPTAC